MADVSPKQTEHKKNSLNTSDVEVVGHVAPVCGIIMPISTIDGCTSEHWVEVRSILKDVIESAGFTPNLVSDADDSGIIQKRIIHNLYNNEIVVCDVSAKNPNVMFELGIRLAFDKPTIIIKDDKTDYSFDTSVIEHIPYPRDLRYNKINIFKDNLSAKIIATFDKSKNDKDYTTFLKHFGEYKVAEISKTSISSDRYVVSLLQDLSKQVATIKDSQRNKSESYSSSRGFVRKEDAEVLRRMVISEIEKMVMSNEKPNEVLESITSETVAKLFLVSENFLAKRGIIMKPEVIEDIILNEILRLKSRL